MPATSGPQNKYNLFLRKLTIAMDQKGCNPPGYGQYICTYIWWCRFTRRLPSLCTPLRTLAVSLSGSGIPSNSQGAAFYTVMQDVPLPLMDSRRYRIYWEAELITDAPQVYVLEKTAVIAGHELRAPEVTWLDKLTSEVSAPSQITDVNSLLHVNRASVWPEQQTYWQAHRYP